LSSTGAWIIVEPGTAAERQLPINGSLLIGRECAGADPSNALILSDPAVSREHVEILANPGSTPTIVDRSTNGTKVNGRRIERGLPLELSDGDRIELGSVALTFCAPAEDEPRLEEPLRAPEDDEALRATLDSTIRETNSTLVAIVLGEIVGYASLIERHGTDLVAAAVEPLFAALDELLHEHQGTVSDAADSAFFAAWDAIRDPDAAARAIEFALGADELVAANPAGQAIEDTLRLGWAVTLGELGGDPETAGLEELYGDAATLAVRVAGIASRAGHAQVLVSARAAAAATRAASYGELEEIHPEGYSSVTWVRAATRA
jgi:pSer/pThr/pTyr-binding forkhead associated (FHA) protein